jgi:DNA-directed RNA polymerase specialized sigma24 family protein
MAWEEFTCWVKSRGAVILAACRLSQADRDDVIAAALKGLIPKVRTGKVRGQCNEQIDAYVCVAVRNQALNCIRSRRRHPERWARSIEGASDVDASIDEVADEALSQEERVILSEQLERIRARVNSWDPVDRYLFFAKLNGVPAKKIQETLKQLGSAMAVATVDTRFHRLRAELLRQFEGS